jgi:hypothetical protein
MRLKIQIVMTLISHHWLKATLSLAVLSVLLLPLNLLATQRFHHDEALYATWALKIVSGDDPWLRDTPLDKPPLYLYIVAGAMQFLGATETAARLPSLLATACIVLLTFWLGRKLYNEAVAILATWLVSLSPFVLLFAPTALTDPIQVALTLTGCLAAVYANPLLAGLCLALAAATKQQALFFIPLVVGLLALGLKAQEPNTEATTALTPTPHTPHYASRFTFYGLRFTLSLTLSLLPFLLWDFTRNQPSAFMELSLRNYGGLTTDPANFGERWFGFIELLSYGTGSSILNLIFLGGCPLLLGYGVWRIRSWKRSVENGEWGRGFSWVGLAQAQADWLIFLFILLFLALHALLSFQVWDRYLLGLIPLLALLLARVLLFPWSIFKDSRFQSRLNKLQPLSGLLVGAAITFLLALTLAAPVQDAINGRYPLGSNSQALSGIEQITAYLQGHAGANHTLYHHWLGTHWRFYLWGYPYDLQYWATPQELAAKAQPGHYIALPAWRSETEVRLALYQANLGLHELMRAYTPDGSPSIILYRLEARY